MNEEEKQTEVIEEGTESTPVETKSESLGSPKPYKNKDREDVWKDDEPNMNRVQLPLTRTPKKHLRLLLKNNALQMLKIECLRNAMTTLNATTIQLSRSTKMNF